MRISFIGDISLNGKYELLYKNGIKPFTKIGSILNDSVVVGNLECFSRGIKGVNHFKKPRLETSLETLSYLKDFNLQVACLANNHVFDHLEDGFSKTKAFLDENNIRSLGVSISDSKFSEPLVLNENGLKIGILNYVTKDTNPSPPQGVKINLNWFDIDIAIRQIIILKKEVNHVVVSLHWGGRVEGGLFPDWDQPKIARRLIDAGADLIIGHHSHTIQPYEIYRGKHVFYSLGNFCFSDFSFEGRDYIMPRRRKDMILPQFSFNKTGYSVKITYWLNQGEQFTENPLYKYRMNVRNFLFLTHKIHAIWKVYFFIHCKINPIFFYFASNNLSLYQKLKSLKWDKIKRQLKK